MKSPNIPSKSDGLAGKFTRRPEKSTGIPGKSSEIPEKNTLESQEMRWITGNINLTTRGIHLTIP